MLLYSGYCILLTPAFFIVKEEAQIIITLFSFIIDTIWLADIVLTLFMLSL